MLALLRTLYSYTDKAAFETASEADPQNDRNIIPLTS